MTNYYLFRSSNTTYNECISKMLVGQRQINSKQVLEIVKGDIIFLHFTGRFLPIEQQFIEGPYFAISNGCKDIDYNAWKGDFPWQVKIEKRGEIARIKQDTFNKFSLRYSINDKFFPFKIPDYIGKKLMNEIGINPKIGRNEIIVESWDTINNIEIDCRLRYEAKYRCEDGHYVRSRMEVIIDNWLYNHFLPHAYEKKVLDLKMISDFYIRFNNGFEYYIEAWGLKDDIYVNRKTEKIKLYKERKINLICINDDILLNLDDYLLNQFSNYL
jgi:hypothetical protein